LIIRYNLNGLTIIFFPDRENLLYIAAHFVIVFIFINNWLFWVTVVFLDMAVSSLLLYPS